MKISYTYILFSLFLAFLPGCELIHDDLPETRTDGEPVYIRLQISTGGEMSATRSNPTGGEDGDGREPGTSDENKIKNITLFLFDADVAMDGDGSTSLIPLSFSGSDLKDSSDRPSEIEQIYTIEKEVRGLDEDSYHILAIANMSFAENEMPKTLGDLRDKIITGTDSPTNFVMSSEELATITGIKASTEQYPAEVDITIERLAAKVDYKVKESSFTTTDKTGTVKILGATLVNDFKKGEYLFKRVGSSIDASTFTYLGDENPTPPGDATNWVIDAYATSNKQADDYNNYYSSFDVATVPTHSNNTDWTMLGYTMENTNDVSGDDLEKYATGVVFKAQYTPSSMPEEADFYYLNGEFYASIDAIKADANVQGMEGLTAENYETYGIDFYDGGICYYTWWIRHSNNANDDIMRYGIVRNNWYRLTVNSIKGLPSGGDDIVIIVAVEHWQPLGSKDLTLKK